MSRVHHECTTIYSSTTLCAAVAESCLSDLSATLSADADRHIVPASSAIMSADMP